MQVLRVDLKSEKMLMCNRGIPPCSAKNVDKCWLYRGLGQCYPTQSSALLDDIAIDLDNSWYHGRSHCVTVQLLAC